MAATKTTRLWSALVSAILAFFASLGLITTQAAAAVPQTAGAGNPATAAPAAHPVPASLVARPFDQSRPPTMKQRIRAEAHNSSPSSRNLKIPRAEARHRADTRAHLWLTEDTALTSHDTSSRPAAHHQHHSSD
ncbi:DUF6344 domain-containing protein [Streptomyces indicus]|uniref:Secreted protein n=1 Tax=Streptomyces indicus TaxID=417292 RepID=A0A1G9F2L6_9ACTN|nr:DUF6344 domain-containing protein [Streptomyces indicus]SDK82571.1 hypothetical protein SAMN05421806_112191 [Streptomyces indicus]